MANKHTNLSELFTAIANAIRTADDSIVGPLIADDFPDIIANIESGIDTTLDPSEAASGADIAFGKKAYVNGILIEGLLEPDPADIKMGVTIAGVDGTFTKVTTNAVGEENIETGKIAFVNGSQVTGKLPLNTTLTFSSATNNSTNKNIAIKGKHTAKFICNANTDMTTTVPYSNIVNAIGLTAAQIKSGESVLGLTGTFSNEVSNPISAATVRNGYIGYVNGAQVKGTMPTVTHPNPTATINSSTGVVTASHTQSTGYVTGSTTTGTLSLPTKGATTITPTATSQTAVSAGTYCTGNITVAASTGYQVKTGTVSGDMSTTFTISGLGFTPKGFIFAPRGVYFDSYWDLFCLYAFNTTSVSGYYKEVTLGSPADYASNWSPTGGSNIDVDDLYDGLYNLLAEDGWDIRMSALYYNDFMAYDASYFGASGYYAEDFFTGAAFNKELIADMDYVSMSGTASYTSGTITVSLDDEYEWMNGYYVAWG